MVTGLILAESSEPVPAAATSEAVQGYARALTESLERKGRAPFVRAGLALWEDLQAIRDSLARCLAWREEPHLRYWHDIPAQRLPADAQPFAEVRVAKEWVDTLRRILDEAPLPSWEEPGLGSDEVARRFAHALGQIADQQGLGPWLESFRQHLFTVSESYWSGLFVGYAIVGLPRTTNDLEGLFGQIKRYLRRQAGLRQLRHWLQRQGAWLVYRSQGETVAALHRRLAQVPVEMYRAERARFAHRQECFRPRYHWRRDAVLAQLESCWASTGPDSS